MRRASQTLSGTTESKCQYSRSKQESGGQEKSGLTVATLISTPNPVSQVLW